MNDYCGIAVFADDLARELTRRGCEVETVEKLPGRASDGGGADVDVLLIQHHEELMTGAEVARMSTTAGAPVVLFAHSEGIDGFVDRLDGVVAMSQGLLPGSGVPTLYFPHPADAPRGLSDRLPLRERFGLPVDAKIVGTSGFLKFDRELVPLLQGLLPHCDRLGWVVQLLTSPWRLESPGLLDEIAALGSRHPGRLVHVHDHLGRKELNLRLQACDLLWCWTRAPSSHYASGVASRLYASGSRMVVADKFQHEHVLPLPNVVRAADDLPRFVGDLTAEMERDAGTRHDPGPMSWEPHTEAITRFLRSVCSAVT